MMLWLLDTHPWIFTALLYLALYGIATVFNQIANWIFQQQRVTVRIHRAPGLSSARIPIHETRWLQMVQHLAEWKGR